VASLVLGGQPFHAKFIKNYFAYVLMTNAVVTYAMIKGGPGMGFLAPPLCLWQAMWHSGTLDMDQTSPPRVPPRLCSPALDSDRTLAGILYIENGSKTFKSLHLPLHSSLAAVWVSLGLGYMALRHRR
jgi:hypothetical protein